RPRPDPVLDYGGHPGPEPRASGGHAGGPTPRRWPDAGVGAAAVCVGRSLLGEASLGRARKEGRCAARGGAVSGRGADGPGRPGVDSTEWIRVGEARLGPVLRRRLRRGAWQPTRGPG